MSKDEYLRWLAILGLIFLILSIVHNYSHASTYSNLIQEVHTVSAERAENVAEAVKRYSDRYRVGSDLIMAVMWTESHFRNVKGQTGEAGYMQIKPATYYKVCERKISLNELINQYHENIRCGVKYLAELQHTHDWYGAISAYNLGYPSKVNEEYVREVLQKRQKVKEFTHGN